MKCLLTSGSAGGKQQADMGYRCGATCSETVTKVQCDEVSARKNDTSN
jgi:hypothetical protein